MGIASPRLVSSGLVSLLLFGAACWLAPTTSESRRATWTPALEVDGAAPRFESPEVPEPAPSTVNTSSEEEPLVDAWTLAAREDGEACRKELASAGFKFRASGDKAQPDKSGCGIPHPVLVFRGPTGITYDPPITVDCSLARALGSVERIVQEEASTHLHSRIVRIGNLGGYACRPRNFRKGASLSAHSFGSAVDVASFQPEKGMPAVIDRDYGEPKRPSPPQEDRRRFLHAVFGRLRHEADLTYAVGPDFNAIHHNHFHLDRGGWHFWFNR
ncbi:MAG: extensin-like protein [Labilithrix sp.]|nr:extensin-like protein [Labilithrix sp.]